MVNLKNLTLQNQNQDILSIILSAGELGQKENIEVLVKPVTYIHNNDSSVSIFKDSFKMLFTLIKLKIKYS